MSRRMGQQQKYYFSDKLKKQLIRITQYPLTLVEASSGFGKTIPHEHQYITHSILRNYLLSRFENDLSKN